MYYHQKGFIPILHQVLGLITSGVFFLYAMITFLPGYLSFVGALPLSEVLIATIKLLAGLMLFLAIPFYFGMLFSSKYPSIMLIRSGIKYMFFFGVCKGIIKWNEIEEVKTQKNGDVILLINRKGLPVFNGLYFLAMHGNKYHEPTLIISRSTENFEDLINNIKSKVAH